MGHRRSLLSTLRHPLPAERSKSLRSGMTAPEQRLWYRLRAGRLFGLKFRRQVPIDRFVVDFLCESRRLILEVDGEDHGTARNDADKFRTARLELLGYRVVRYWNNEVMGNIEGVLEDLCKQLELPCATRDPLPGPPPRGREKS